MSVSSSKSYPVKVARVTIDFSPDNTNYKKCVDFCGGDFFTGQCMFTDCIAYSVQEDLNFSEAFEVLKKGWKNA